MANEGKINIKLEVSKDKTTGKLSITAHFNNSAPNVIKENDTYYWIPTNEEKDFLTEAFNYFPNSAEINKPTNPITEEKKETTERPKKENLTPTSEIKYENKNKVFKEENNVNPPDVFEVTDDNFNNKTETTTDDIKKVEEQTDAETDGIVEADLDAIEEALKKHGKKEDKSMVQADEKTIVDKVLSQKKKGKWSRK